MTEARAQNAEAQDDQSVREWLGSDEIASGSLLALTHVHRYELAARLLSGRRTVDLCCGTGYGSAILARSASRVTAVDRNPDALAEVPDDQAIEPVQADAVEFLSGLGADDCDAIVCFEGIEHVEDPDALAEELARLAAHGVAVVISLPNSVGFDERNPYHVTDFSYERALELFARLGDGVVLGQYHAEGSLLLESGAANGDHIQGALAHGGPPDLAWAVHWIAVVNVPTDAVSETVAHMRLSTSPGQNDYMRALERANVELHRTNVRLGRARLGVHDSAAAFTVARVHELEERLAREIEIAAQNDRYFQAARAVLQSPRHRAVEAIHRRLVRVPGGAGLARVFGRLYLVFTRADDGR
jgi:2-polyprenyl-3-methyl-5-hydroxy-6-metoxy-1,4-benzoquinol methylase